MVEVNTKQRQGVKYCKGAAFLMQRAALTILTAANYLSRIQ
jgi:hypothetical protein